MKRRTFLKGLASLVPAALATKAVKEPVTRPLDARDLELQHLEKAANPSVTYSPDGAIGDIKMVMVKSLDKPGDWRITKC